MGIQDRDYYWEKRDKKGIRRNKNPNSIIENMGSSRKKDKWRWFVVFFLE